MFDSFPLDIGGQSFLVLLQPVLVPAGKMEECSFYASFSKPEVPSIFTCSP